MNGFFSLKANFIHSPGPKRAGLVFQKDILTHAEDLQFSYFGPAKTIRTMGGNVCLVVSILTFFFDGPSLNPEGYQ